MPGSAFEFPFLDPLMARLAQWEWLGILLARLSVGSLFALSGSGKLFRRDRRAAMRRTLEEAHIPWPDLNAIFIGGVEFGFGTLLVLGAFMPLACLMLGAVMIVALVTTRVKGIKATTALDRLSEFLYLPEVMYLVILVWLFFSGPGWLSLDRVLR
jgi:putative oxidoreductase